VDNTPPRYERLSWDENGQQILATVRDEGLLSEVSLRQDGGPWRPLIPDDGVTDDRSEEFSVDLSSDEHGFRDVSARRFWLRAVDRAGNTTLQELRAPRRDE